MNVSTQCEQAWQLAGKFVTKKENTILIHSIISFIFYWSMKHANNQPDFKWQVQPTDVSKIREIELATRFLKVELLIGSFYTCILRNHCLQRRAAREL